MKTAPRVLQSALLWAAASLALLGCKSLTKSDPASFAAVRITGHTPEQIHAATMAVFQQDGYEAARVARSELVFEKEGSRWDQIAYGNWVDSNPVWIRVRVSLVPLSDGVFRLQCQAFRVRDKDDTVPENEVRLKNNHSKPYQALLDKVLGRLGQ
jgi:hypothetical protein